ncbi:MAG: 6-carboxytetrahydropterin synthase QueD [Deltaproteobacteria bacterium]|nr:6-carboxytetrahydropterin synthase QueD [Deltaproteobacteria bacterium]
MFELKILTHFAAAHKLKMVAQKCENLHGHNWKVEVCVAGETLDKAGVLMDFGDVKKYLAEIMQKLDHKYLNELDYFEGGQPTSENIAIFIVKELQASLDHTSVKVSRVNVWESENACASYII